MTYEIEDRAAQYSTVSYVMLRHAGSHVYTHITSHLANLWTVRERGGTQRRPCKAFFKSSGDVCFLDTAGVVQRLTIAVAPPLPLVVLPVLTDLSQGQLYCDFLIDT